MTDDTYYNILEKCTIEAFDCLKTKDFYPNNGTKASWDVSSFTIEKGDGLPTDNDNELFRKAYIKENMRVTFLMALDRCWKDLEIKYSITRSFFYKKCYQSLLFKTSQSSLWHKPNFGFDINAEPCVLTFVWNMKEDIEARSIECQHPTPEAVKPDEVLKPQTKPIKPKKEFKDYFNSDINIEVIEKIQKDFKDSIGKKMAYLIYLLETDLKFITYSLNGKNDSRKHFVESLINKTISMQGINKYFEPHDVKLNIFQFEKESDYINTKEKLTKAIK